MRVLIEVGLFLIVLCLLWYTFDRLVLRPRRTKKGKIVEFPRKENDSE